VSADNWTTCPRCEENARRRYEEEDERVAAMYGVVSPAQYAAARDRLVATDLALGETFREDYEVYGASDGEVHVDYRGKCTVCGLTVSVGETRRFYPEPSDA
jgi:hypothetical protein